MSAADDTLRRRVQARVGKQLKEKWRLDAVLGIGGVACVYAATHRNGTRAAIKILDPELAALPEVRDRFLQEGYASNSVGHPGVVQVLDDDITQDNEVFLVMELLEGQTLGERAEAHGGKLPPGEVLAAAAAVLDVLAMAHQKGVLHRDLKPDNIFLTEDGAVKVLDFGLARVKEMPQHQKRAGTRFGYTMGTPGFMAPEQARGQWFQVDARSDLWALGATMFSLLSGKQLHEDEEGHPSFHLAATRSAPSLDEVSPGLPRPVVELVSRALAAPKASRWQSAEEMRGAVEAALKMFADHPLWRAGASASVRVPRHAQVSQVAHTAMAPVRVSTPPRSMPSVNNTHAVEIAPDTYWVGKRDPGAIFHANPFLRIFRGSDGAASYNMLIDPGSSSDYAVVSAKVNALIGGMGRLNAMFINHQDPDVGSSAAAISARHAPKAAIMCSEPTWRLIVHFNLPRERFVDTERHAGGMTLSTGHRVLPVPTPFCHFRGAVALYDPETRVLFTGDLLGGLTPAGAEGLWADESDWGGVRAFHQMYMPASRALSMAVRAIRRLEPPVEIIAPQHGRLLRGAMMTKFLERLERLPVGLDTIDEVGDGPDAMAAWTSVLRRVLYTARLVLGDEVDARLAQMEDLRDTATVTGDEVEVRAMGRWTLGTVVEALTRGEPPEVVNPIQLEVIYACEQLELPSPALRIEGAEDMGEALITG
ncbi:protein kinase domain-containing protein [Chondromyces apiculatus]|uniref:Metallo-beta-lactamase family protein n=1 Tax=Chondromyces apiculatus DSM 436 TaxID=1192034 RepID=A0A017SVL9_9BACT|nr:protein kinase [Chondromyces apiculatus]EYF00640.1 metallo-beta-lactamase family protein [Chondromyces apiculatus DSM 436]